MVHFSYILYIEMFTVVIEILEIETKILKQVGRIFFVSLNFINCKIWYFSIFLYSAFYILMEMCSSNTNTYLLMTLTAELTPRAFIYRSEMYKEHPILKHFHKLLAF